MKIYHHYENYNTFNAKKLSAQADNTKYTVGIEGSVTSGTPDINWQCIVFIKDTKQIWTHGRLYTCRVTGAMIEDLGFTKNAGTITKVQANGTDVASSGVANIPAANISGRYGVTTLSNSTSSKSTTVAATANAVRLAYELASKADNFITNDLLQNFTRIEQAMTAMDEGISDLGWQEW